MGKILRHIDLKQKEQNSRQNQCLHELKAYLPFSCEERGLALQMSG